MTLPTSSALLPHLLSIDPYPFASGLYYRIHNGTCKRKVTCNSNSHTNRHKTLNGALLLSPEFLQPKIKCNERCNCSKGLVSSVESFSGIPVVVTSRSSSENTIYFMQSISIIISNYTLYLHPHQVYRGSIRSRYMRDGRGRISDNL